MNCANHNLKHNGIPEVMKAEVQNGTRTSQSIIEADHTQKASKCSLGKGRVELPRLAAHDPKSCLSASSSTSPRRTNERQKVDQEVNQLLTSELLTEFLQSRRDGTSEHTLKFYHRCLKRFIGHEFTPQDINDFLHNLDCGNAKHSYYRAIRAPSTSLTASWGVPGYR